MDLRTNKKKKQKDKALFVDDIAHPASISQLSAAAERRGIKPYRASP
jgi:hypothetical protein